MTTNDFTLLNRSEYFKQLIRLSKKAKSGDRIAIATMGFDSSEPLIAELVSTLCTAAARGANVQLIVDAYTFLARNRSFIPGPLWFGTPLSQQLSEPFKSHFNALEALKSSGGHYAITNIPGKPFSTPYAGRSHIKTAVMNNLAFIGGCNLEDASNIDIMVAWNDKKAADWLHKWTTRMITTGSTTETFGGKDRYLRLNPDLQLLIDAGVRKQSTIYDHAMQLIDKAEESIYLTCQFFPGGKTTQHLLQAHKRGVDIRIIYSHPFSHGSKAPGHILYNSRERMRLPAEFFVEQRNAKLPLLHAKVLATEKGVMVGSHNYVTQGVWLGTAEIALQSSDPDFAQAVVRKIGSEL